MSDNKATDFPRETAIGLTGPTACYRGHAALILTADGTQVLLMTAGTNSLRKIAKALQPELDLDMSMVYRVGVMHTSAIRMDKEEEEL